MPLLLLPLLPRNNITVSGVVKGVGGSPLPNVSVMIKGISGGTVTDNNGHFELKNIPGNRNPGVQYW